MSRFKLCNQILTHDKKLMRVGAVILLSINSTNNINHQNNIYLYKIQE
jgi:hypothetical protein